jgi:putative sigma-54 modulation protein
MLKTEILPEIDSTRVIVSGIHLPLTPALRQAATEKAIHLLDHESDIIRVRIDLEVDHTREPHEQHIAKGRLEVRGPDLIARVASENAYKSLDLLVDKFAEALRRRRQKRVNTRNDERRQAPKTHDGSSE